MVLPYCPRGGAMANNHDIPELMPVPEQLHVFDVYRMRVRFEDDPTKSRNHTWPPSSYKPTTTVEWL